MTDRWPLPERHKPKRLPRQDRKRRGKRLPLPDGMGQAVALTVIESMVATGQASPGEAVLLRRAVRRPDLN